MPVTVTADGSRDDGGYINLGTLGKLGSSLTSTAGKSYCFWIRTVDANNIIPLGFNWFAYDPMGNPYMLFQLNSKWTTDYTGEANSVNIFVDGTNSVGWSFWKATGVNFNDGTYHHHCISWTGLSSNKPVTLDYYIDGVLTGGSWTDYSDGNPNPIVDFARDVYMGCTQKTVSNVLQDFASFRLADFRIYDRGLSGAEIKQIYLQRGRDTIRRGLHSRYNFRINGSNIGYHGVPAILAQDGVGITPTYNTDHVLRGVRRKVM